MPIPYDIGPVEIGATQVRGSAAAGASVVGWAGEAADPVLYDPVVLEGVRLAPAAAAIHVAAPHGVHATVRAEARTVGTPAPAVELAELRTGWDAPPGYGGVGIGRLHVPLSSDRRYEAEGMALAFRPLLSQFGTLPLHADGIDGRVAWPDRAALHVGTVWTTAWAGSPFVWARLDVTPLGPLPDHEDDPAPELRVAAGGTVAIRQSPRSVDERWLAGDLTVAWRSLGADVGWISREAGGAVSDDQWIAGHARLVRLPAETDLFVAGRLEWTDGIVDGEQVRMQATGRVSWRIHPPDEGFLGGDPSAWGAVYAEGALSREQGTGLPEPATGTALVLEGERTNDWLQVGVWTRW